MTVSNDIPRYEHGVPVIDLSPIFLHNDDAHGDDEDLSSSYQQVAEQIADACCTYGFFQITSHGMSPDLIRDFKTQMEAFFDLPYSTKVQLKRHERNARGYFDDELTKRRRDWKEAYDFGVPGSRDWNSSPDNSNDNNAERMTEGDGCLDGYNQFPTADVLPQFRSTMIAYFDACTKLADKIAILMGIGLGIDARRLLCHDTTTTTTTTTTRESSIDCDDNVEEAGGIGLIENLRKHHTSYLRMNYYPPYPPPPLESSEHAASSALSLSSSSSSSSSDPPPLGISPHTDAGFLTILVHDEDCHSLQVARRTSHEAGGSYNDDDDSNDIVEWVTVRPVPGALTINTGDMAMIWSNGKYRAPLHRVRTDPTKVRYSAPFFYNPGYKARITPLVLASSIKNEQPRYNTCVWGYFRAVRFAGDLTDFGAEIQVSDYLITHDTEKNDDDDHNHNTNGSLGMKDREEDREENEMGQFKSHIDKQKAFLKVARFDEPFSVEKYRPLLETKDPNSHIEQ